MKIAYHRPEEVQRALDRMNEETIEEPAEEQEEEDSEEEVEFEINFDPPRAPIRIASPDQIPISVGFRRNYAISSEVLSELLRRKQEELTQKKITTLRLNKVCFSNQDNGLWASTTQNLLDLRRVHATTCNNINPDLWLDHLAQLPNLKSGLILLQVVAWTLLRSSPCNNLQQY